MAPDFHHALSQTWIILFPMTITKTVNNKENVMMKMRRHTAALAMLAESESPIISAYFDLRLSRDQLLSELKLWAVGAQKNLPRVEREVFVQTKEEVIGMFLQKWPDSIRSLAIFSRLGKHPFLMVLPFEAEWETFFHVGSRPTIFPLVQLKDRFHRFALAICSENSARIVEMNLGTIHEDIHVAKSLIDTVGVHYVSKEHAEHRRNEESRRFAREKARVIVDLMSRQGLNHLILAGHQRHVASVREQLPKNVLASVVGILPQAPNGHNCSVLIDSAVEMFVQAEQRESRATVEKVMQESRRGGLVSMGIHACAEAIKCGAASQLVISEELHMEDREELVLMAVLHDLPIEVCEQDELLRSHGGVACLLRFRMEYLQLKELQVS